VLPACVHIQQSSITAEKKTFENIKTVNIFAIVMLYNTDKSASNMLLELIITLYKTSLLFTIKLTYRTTHEVVTSNNFL